MTEREFNDEFWAYHCGNFPGLRTWLADKVPEGEHRTVWNAWARQLRYADLEDAKAASDEIAAMERSPVYEKHPRTIAIFACRRRTERERKRPAGARMVDGQETFRCLTCRDDGIVEVWSRISMHFAAPDRIPRPPNTTAPEGARLGDRFTVYKKMVRCTCEAAEKWRWMPVVFDAKRWLPIGVKGTSDREEQQKLIEFVGQLKPTGYREEFAAFG